MGCRIVRVDLKDSRSTGRWSPLDRFWVQACAIAEKAWDAATDGHRIEAAQKALEEKGIIGNTAGSVLTLLADGGRSE